MKVADLHAEADIVGRRVRVSWEYVLEEADTLADIPAVVLRRKLRDYEFPPPTGTDPYLLYASSAFPPASAPPALFVTELDGWNVRAASGEETVYEALSLARPVNGQPVEFLRVTTSTTFDISGLPVHRRVEVLDYGGTTGAPNDSLTPGVMQYYQLTRVGAPPGEPPLRAFASPGDSYGLNRSLYESLPEVYRRHDVTLRPTTAGSDSVPEMIGRVGQLRRFLDPFGLALDLLRSQAEGLRGLRDIDNVDPKFLPFLAAWIGWDFSYDAAIPLQRNEIKSAARLYRGVGTAPALRAIVNRYTGWNTQVAEFAQNIFRAGQVAQLNLFAIRQVGADWFGADMADDVLGFLPGNDQAVGAAGAAELTGLQAEPFVLRRGMELTLEADGGLPETMHFDEDDFVRMDTASATEVAAAINGTLERVRAESVAGGHVRLRSRAIGATSTLQVFHPDVSLVSLESAPGGRLCAVTDPQDRRRLFYTERAGAGQENDPGPRLRMKTFAYSGWSDARDIPSLPGTALAGRADPAGLSLPDGGVWLAWVQSPGSASTLLQSMRSSARLPQPAQIHGQRRGPFNVPAGTRLALRGRWVGLDVCIFVPADFANPSAATAVEVAAALNSRLVHTNADVLPNGALRLSSNEDGPQARLIIDLQQSVGISALGFDLRRLTATGSWDDRMDWHADPNSLTATRPETLTAPGRHAEPFVLRDERGGMRLFWARHSHGFWHVVTRRWDGQLWAATSAGISVLPTGGAWQTITTADGLASNDVRSLTLDADGAVIAATSAGVSRRNPTGTWTTFTTAQGLPSNNVVRVVVGEDGSLWAATAGGAATLPPGAAGWVAFTTAQGLPSNDVRDVALDEYGRPWLATASGVAAQGVNGIWQTFTIANGLPSNDIRSVAFAPNAGAGSETGEFSIIPWVAAAGGLARWNMNGIWSIVRESGGAVDDGRGLAIAPDGTLWCAGSSGLVRRLSSGNWQVFTSADGLPSHDVRAVTVAADGVVWVSTPSGSAQRLPAGVISPLGAAQGLASNNVRGIQTAWSSSMQLSASEANSAREPAAVMDAGGRTWLFWSRERAPGALNDAWTLRQRIYDPASSTWSAEADAIAPSTPAAADRQPACLLLPDGSLRLFFRSNRDGDVDVWSCKPSDPPPAGAPTRVVSGPATDSAPTPLVFPGGELWLLFRSDHNLALATIAPPPALGKPNGGMASAITRRSAALPDAGSLRRFAGCLTLVPADLQRNRGRRLFGDLLAYTVQRPDGTRPRQDEFYTRGTIGLYVTRPSTDTPITSANVQRLLQILAAFLPINLRAIIILAPQLDAEYVYSPGADLQDTFQDVYPFLEIVGGVNITDSSMVNLPGWGFLHTNTAGETTADPGNLGSLKRRTFYPPPL